MSKRIGWIGTGNLGSAIVMRLLNQGYDVYVYNRTKEKTKPLEMLGAHIISSPKELTNYCNILFLCLGSKEAIESVLFEGELAVFKKKVQSITIIDTSTIGSEFAIQLERTIDSFNSYYIECPVSGGPENALQGRLTAILSGKKEIVIDIVDIVKSFCGIVHNFHEPGKAQLLKVLNNLAESINLIGASEVISLGSKYGLKIEEMYRVFYTMRGNSKYMDVLFERLLHPNEQVAVSLGIRTKDLSLSKELTETNYSPISNLTQSLFDNVVELLGNDMDQTECIKLFQSKDENNESHKEAEKVN